jgi:hypothetical protein
MKKLILPTLFLTNILFGQLTYVDNFDGVYPYSGASTFNFDINSDGQNDIRLWRFSSTSSVTCNGTSSLAKYACFRGLTNTYGLNLMNGNGSSIIGIDCTNDTLNINDSWNEYSLLFRVTQFPNGICENIGYGTHKQGFRLILTNPVNGALGYKYGYINYTLTNVGDIIIHDWYYENTFNVPIVANSQLQYPYDGNCIHYDTVTVQDTLVTQIYDTITTHINVYDTVLVSVTDTLIINTTLNLPAPNNNNVIKVYPNPASDHITIDNGNFALMSGYTLKIENTAGQQVFNSVINQSQFYLDISTWTGNGMYYIHLIDPQNNTVTIRKIVVQ